MFSRPRQHHHHHPPPRRYYPNNIVLTTYNVIFSVWPANLRHPVYRTTILRISPLIGHPRRITIKLSETRYMPIITQEELRPASLWVELLNLFVGEPMVTRPTLLTNNTATIKHNYFYFLLLYLSVYSLHGALAEISISLT